MGKKYFGTDGIRGTVNQGNITGEKFFKFGLASVLYGLSQGVQLFRVHNVKEINQGILVFNKILNTN